MSKRFVSPTRNELATVVYNAYLRSKHAPESMEMFAEIGEAVYNWLGGRECLVKENVIVQKCYLHRDCNLNPKVGHCLDLRCGGNCVKEKEN